MDDAFRSDLPSLKMMIIDGRSLEAAAVLATELAVIGDGESARPSESGQFGEGVELWAETDDSLIHANHCPLLWGCCGEVTCSDRNQFFHSIRQVVPQEGDDHCIQLVEYFKRGLDNVEGFLSASKWYRDVAIGEELCALHPLFYESLQNHAKVPPHTPKWYSSLECVRQGSALLASQLSSSSCPPRSGSRGSNLSEEAYRRSFIAYYMNLFFNSASQYLQVLRTKHISLAPVGNPTKPSDIYVIACARHHS